MSAGRALNAIRRGRRTFVTLCLVSLGVAVGATYQGARALEEAEVQAQLTAKGLANAGVASVLVPGDVSSTIGGDVARDLLSRLRRGVLADGTAFRVRVWSPSGDLLFSTDAGDAPDAVSSELDSVDAATTREADGSLRCDRTMPRCSRRSCRCDWARNVRSGRWRSTKGMRASPPGRRRRGPRCEQRVRSGPYSRWCSWASACCPAGRLAAVGSSRLDANARSLPGRPRPRRTSSGPRNVLGLPTSELPSSSVGPSMRSAANATPRCGRPTHRPGSRSLRVRWSDLRATAADAADGSSADEETRAAHRGPRRRARRRCAGGLHRPWRTGSGAPRPRGDLATPRRHRASARGSRGRIEELRHRRARGRRGTCRRRRGSGSRVGCAGQRRRDARGGAQMPAPPRPRPSSGARLAERGGRSSRCSTPCGDVGG